MLEEREKEADTMGRVNPLMPALGLAFRRVVGAFVFLVGSTLCGAAWGMTELILFRGVQGWGRA